MPVINLITGVPYRKNSRHLPYELKASNRMNRTQPPAQPQFDGPWMNPHYVPPPRKEKRVTRNDKDRREWVLSDEGLYNMQRASSVSLKEWVKRNRAMIDEVIDNINSGRRKEHYLVYG